MIISVTLVSILAAVLCWSRLAPAVLKSPAQPKRTTTFPTIILWAWERPEMLDFIDPARIGVAFLAKTIFLTEARVVARARFQPLKVPSGTILIAVARIETDKVHPAQLSQSQHQQLLTQLKQLAELPNITALQLDFDAVKSERQFYRKLLNDLRREMPASKALSITALASWAIYDDWLSGVPIDEAVPMLFRLGVDERQVKSFLNAGLKSDHDFSAPIYRESFGISLDEPLPVLPAGRRVYIFNPRPWSMAAVDNIVRKINSW